MNRIILLICLFLVATLSLNAQSDKIVELEKKLVKATDTSRVNVLNAQVQNSVILLKKKKQSQLLF